MQAENRLRDSRKKTMQAFTNFCPFSTFCRRGSKIMGE